MAMYGSHVLFLGVAAYAAVAAVYIAVQPPGETAVPVEDQRPFVAAGYDTAPASFDNDPRSPDESEADLEPIPERPAYAEFEAEFDYDYEEAFLEEE